MNDQNNLIDGLNTSQILVGLDLGTKTIGVAVSDRSKIIATPLSIIQRKGTNKDLIIMKDILKEYEIGGFILGLPISLDNSENKQSQLVRDFNINLQTFFKKPTALWDERFSSDVIFKEMRKADLSKTKTRFDVSATLPLSVGMRIIIDKEIMKIKEIVDANTIVVYRGYESTVATHIEGSSIDVLTAADDLLVEPDDDFGFNGIIESFSDSRSYSPTQQKDI